MSCSNLPETPDAATVLGLAPIVPVLTIPEVATAVPLARALVEGGLPVLEVTLRTAAGLDAIREISNAVPGALVGAGTVRSAAEFEAAVEAGSRFVVSPGFTESLRAAASACSVALIPGVATASEVMRAREAGFDHVKFFPAEVAGGVKALKALGGPFPDMRFCPTGGVSLDNLAEYLAVDAVVTVGGTWVTPVQDVSAGNWDTIRDLAADAARMVRVIRGSS